MAVYDKYLTGSLAENYRAALQDTDALDLSEELALMRAKLAECLEQNNIKAMPAIVTQIRKLSEAIGKNIENARNYIPVSMLGLVVDEVARLVGVHVKDQNVVGQLRSALGRIRLPANSREARQLDRAVREGEVPGA